eukprot:g12115.t1 g12115   contig6:1244019-1244666(+)
MQVIGAEFAAKSGDNVRAIYDTKRAQLKDDEDDDASSISSKQTKSEMFIGGSVMKLANNNVMIAQINAQEKEKDRQEKEKDRQEKEMDRLAAEEIHRTELEERQKDRVEREKDRILQRKQSLEVEISRLRQDKRDYLMKMSERDEKRRKTRRNDDDDDDSTDTFRMILDDIVEEIQEKKAKLEELVRDESDMTKTPLKSNVTPTSHRQGQMDDAM